jgi:flavorubredoxin
MAEAQEKLPERLKPMLEELSEEFKEVLKRSQGNTSILLHTASLYGASRMMAYALGRRCEEQTARVLRLAKEGLSNVAEYLDAETKEDHRRLIIKLAALEALLYQTAAQCAGLKNGLKNGLENEN